MNAIENNGVSYFFKDKELEQLALFLRANAGRLPRELELLSEFAETYVYNKMTIAEAECFFKDSLS